MPPDKDYSFATFSSVTEAEVKVKALNGVCVQTIPNTAHLPAHLVNGLPLHLYLSFVTTIPEYVSAAAPISPPSLPLGLALMPNFITSAEEEELLAFFDSAHTNPSHLKHRQVFHYGYQFNYDTNNVDICAPLPGGFPPLIQHLVSKVVSSGCVRNTPDQITVNRYPPGAGACTYTCESVHPGVSYVWTFGPVEWPSNFVLYREVKNILALLHFGWSSWLSLSRRITVFEGLTAVH